MKKLVSVLVVAVFAVTMMFAGKSFADEAAAKALVEKAVAQIKKVGKQKALASFNNKQGGFTDGELYVFVVDFDGNTLAHGGNEKLIGQSMFELQDVDGKYFIKEMIETAKTKGAGWVDYKFQNPKNKKIEQKTSYVKKVDNYFVGCGTYKKMK